MNSATQSAIGYVLARLLDTPQLEGDDAVSNLTIKDVFAVCSNTFCSINSAPIGRLVYENMRKQRAMLAQADTKRRLLRLGRS